MARTSVALVALAAILLAAPPAFACRLPGRAPAYLTDERPTSIPEGAMIMKVRIARIESPAGEFSRAFLGRCEGDVTRGNCRIWVTLIDVAPGLQSGTEYPLADFVWTSCGPRFEVGQEGYIVGNVAIQFAEPFAG